MPIIIIIIILLCTLMTLTEKDIRRLKWNWFFVSFVSVLRAMNYSTTLPTNHQFIINPTAESLNNLTNEVIIRVNY